MQQSAPSSSPPLPAALPSCAAIMHLTHVSTPPAFLSPLPIPPKSNTAQLSRFPRARPTLPTAVRPRRTVTSRRSMALQSSSNPTEATFQPDFDASPQPSANEPLRLNGDDDTFFDDDSSFDNSSTSFFADDDADDDTLAEQGSSKSRRKSAKLPVIAVVGRPNVGKSTLVNRLSGTFRTGSIVEDVVGITRDRTYRRSLWNGVPFSIVDTGGLVFDDQSTFLPEIRAQALVAIREASAVVLCVDGQHGLNPLDVELGSFLRKEISPKCPTFVAVNKCESDKGFVLAAEFWALGLGEPYPVSAIHGSGTGDLLDKITESIPKVDEEEEDNIVNVAIVGRPNVGKSSLLNLLTGKERAIVSTIPGTTRDAVDEIITVNGRQYRLIDTAGIRRKTSVDFGTEFFMINRALRAIRRADVALLLLDVSEASEQDRKIADRIVDEGKACVVLANKWDLILEKDNRSYKKTVERIQDRTVSIPWAPVELISVTEKKRVNKVIGMVDSVLKEHRRRVSTAVLNEVLREAVDWHKPPSTRQGKQGRIYYCTQVSTMPPTVAMFVNDPRLFSDNYRRYMEGQLRKSLGLIGTPVRVLWRGKAKAPNLA